MTVHRTDLLGGSTPYLSVSLLDTTTARSGSWRIPLAAVLRDDTLWADAMVVQTATDYRISVRAEGLELRLTVYPQSSPWGPPQRRLFVEQATGRSNNWHVPVPHGRATGEVRWRGRAARLEGGAYLDHNWGELPLHEGLTAWAWTAIARPGGTTVAATVCVRDGERIQLTNAASGSLAAELNTSSVTGSPNPAADSRLQTAAQLLGWSPDSSRLRLVKQQLYRRPRLAELNYTRWAIIADRDRRNPDRVLGGFLETAIVTPLGPPAVPSAVSSAAASGVASRVASGLVQAPDG
ncbi:hypothetical protein [Kitasatospora azatica]|uniref:hypothetical protein n=1 Tax=Kitasatospora azatica TaxID=58347 RepID=UPI00056C3833|nr:hypothetical protein [Kitasatospora azatica]